MILKGKNMKDICSEKQTYTVAEIAQILNIGKNSAYKLVSESKFKSVRIGKIVRISRQSFDDWLERELNVKNE